MEVLTRVHCAEPGCGKTLEYWAYLTVELDTPWHDSFGNESQPDPVLKVSPPEDKAWSTEGKYTSQYYCPEHTKPKRKNK